MRLETAADAEGADEVGGENVGDDERTMKKRNGYRRLMTNADQVASTEKSRG